MNKISTASKSLFSSRKMTFLIPAILAIFLLGTYIAFFRFKVSEKTVFPTEQKLTSTTSSTPGGRSSDFPIKVINGTVEDIISGTVKVKDAQGEIKDFRPDNETEYWIASLSGSKEPQKIKAGKIDLVKRGDSVIVASREDNQNILVTSIIIYR